MKILFNKKEFKKALIYEGVAIFLMMVIVPHILKGVKMLDIGLLGVFFSTLTVVLLYFYNICFDRIIMRRYGSTKKNGVMRILHAIFFECLLATISLPTIAWWLNITLLKALGLEIAAIIFFAFYTYVFHVIADLFQPKEVAVQGELEGE